MVFFFIKTPRTADTPTLLLDKEKTQDSRSERLELRTLGLSGYVSSYGIPYCARDESGDFLISECARDLLEHYRINSAVARLSNVGSRISTIFTPYVIRALHSIDEVCNVLRSWGEYTLADRIAYFASDEDLDDGDVPVTLESAHGFLTFFSEVESDGKVGLACSQEGWICAEWRFTDQRRASLWFLDEDRIMFAATDGSGDFIEIEGNSEICYRSVVAAKLVEAGLLKWWTSNLTSTSFHPTSMLHDIAGPGTSSTLAYSPPTPSYSGTKSLIYQPTGWSTFTLPTELSKFPQSVAP